jgi:hypothetical protein
VTEALACEIQEWGLKHLEIDPYADRLRNCSYQTTTVYLDSPQFDMFHRAPGFRGRKYRLRRYGAEQDVSLERKVRRKDRVKKRRARVALDRLECSGISIAEDSWEGEWFREAVQKRDLCPSCCLTYDRAAFMKATDAGTLRLTLDRRIRGSSTESWQPNPIAEGTEILQGQVICELKFRDVMPPLFQSLVTEKQLTPASVSKYRLMMAATRGWSLTES